MSIQNEQWPHASCGHCGADDCPEDFIGACDPSLLSDSLPGQPKPRDTMRLPKRMDWDNGEMVPHSSGEYCEHENVCEILGERDAYIATLETKLAAANKLAEAVRELVGWVAIYRINPDDQSNKKGMIEWAKQTSEALTAYQSQTNKEQDER